MTKIFADRNCSWPWTSLASSILASLLRSMLPSLLTLTLWLQFRLTLLSRSVKGTCSRPPNNKQFLILIFCSQYSGRRPQHLCLSQARPHRYRFGRSQLVGHHWLVSWCVVEGIRRQDQTLCPADESKLWMPGVRYTFMHSFISSTIDWLIVLLKWIRIMLYVFGAIRVTASRFTALIAERSIMISVAR